MNLFIQISGEGASRKILPKLGPPAGMYIYTVCACRLHVHVYVHVLHSQCSTSFRYIYACKIGDVTFEKRGDLASVFFVNVLAKVKDIHVHVDQA